jgi:hypothetical protein
MVPTVLPHMDDVERTAIDATITRGEPENPTR